MMPNPELWTNNESMVNTVQQIIEFIGTFAFAISGIRQAAAKKFDWFGGFVCGFAVAIGGGTIRDLMLGVTPFWMTSYSYIICTIIAQLFLIVFARYMKKLNNAWMVFDTLGLALFTIVGMQKTLLLLDVNIVASTVITFFVICTIRFWAVRFHISLPILRNEELEEEK